MPAWRPEQGDQAVFPDPALQGSLCSTVCLGLAVLEALSIDLGESGEVQRRAGDRLTENNKAV